MQDDKDDVEKNLQSLESLADEANRMAESIEEQLVRLGYGMMELEAREKTLVRELDRATWPNNLGDRRQPADIAMDLAAVRAGCAELGHFIRTCKSRHSDAISELEQRRGNVQSFKYNHKL